MRTKLMLGIAAALLVMPQTRNYILGKVSTIAKAINDLVEESKDVVKEAKQAAKS